MCGIIGYSGKRETKEVLLRALASLEYRGYDSAGITVFDENDRLLTVKSVGKIDALRRKVEERQFSSRAGIGHTRWATHGAPTDYNSHPHGTSRVMLVHNGIIENYAEIKNELLDKGYTFRSETDTEVAAVLLDSLYTGNAGTAIFEMRKRLRGSYALGIVFYDQPNVIYAVREGSPLLIGVGENESFITSDITAILAYTKRYITLSEGCVARLSGGDIRLFGKDGRQIPHMVDTAEWDIHAAERGGFPHFMKKEIFEEPSVVCACLRSRIKDGFPDFSCEGLDEKRFADARRIVFVACGTAMHASLLAKYNLEKYARIKTDVEIASEFRYANPILSKEDIVIAVSQSGETADTLAALRLAKSMGAYTVGVVNAVGSTVARESDTVLYTHAGPEIAVASTKAYTAQSTLLLLFALFVARVRGTLEENILLRLTKDIEEGLPSAISAVLLREKEIERAAKALSPHSDAFFIGRGADYYAALEASLKLKEISYIHSEAYAAGEMKHGTISLIEQDTPVVAVLTAPSLEEKLCANVKEVSARGARVFAVTAGGTGALDGVCDEVLALSSVPESVAPIAVATALQLYAYFAATQKGCNVDQPRNLAKSVTVE